MNGTDLRKLNREALKQKLADLKEELFNLRFQHAINQLENPNKLKEVKRDIARVKTIMRANELSMEQGYAELDAAEVAAPDEKPAKKIRSRAAKAAEETAEEKPKARGRKTAKPEAEIIDKTKEEETEKIEEIDDVEETEAVDEANVGDNDPVVPAEEAEESAADQKAQDEQTEAPKEEE